MTRDRRWWREGRHAGLELDEPIAASYLAATATDETAIVNGEGSAR